MFDLPTSPKSCARLGLKVPGKVSRLERANERLAALDAKAPNCNHLRWLHPTKGWRRKSHRAMYLNATAYHDATSLPFPVYLHLVSQGRYRKRP